MRIVTLNCNGIRSAASKGLFRWLPRQRADVLCLQETKLTDENFPADEISAAGYEVVFSGQKPYNGVATISKSHATDIVTDVPGLDDPQRRILCTTINGVRVLNLYVVNGQEVGSDKFAHKLHWLEMGTGYIGTQLKEHEHFVVLGDFNIAPADADVHDPEAWHERILCSTPERDALGRMLELGLQDTFRLFPQEEKSFSWWDYRAAAFRRNMGLRIDLILASQSLVENCTACHIDKAPRRLERPSDHTPVVAEFSL
jgi:exodeoxyribonuclease-3